MNRVVPPSRKNRRKLKYIADPNGYSSTTVMTNMLGSMNSHMSRLLVVSSFGQHRLNLDRGGVERRFRFHLSDDRLHDALVDHLRRLGELGQRWHGLTQGQCFGDGGIPA